MTMTSELNLSAIFADARTNLPVSAQQAGTYVSLDPSHSGLARSGTVGTYVTLPADASSISNSSRGQYVGGTVYATDPAGSYVTL